jgi:predicted ferric reductase
MKMGGVVLLVLGILFLLRDLNVWNFWNIQWWTVVFIMVGLFKICISCCPECKIEAKKKK